jgi:hypothetical protein
MADTIAIAAFGTLLKRGDGATPEVFTTIAEVGDIDGPKLKTTMEDATTQSSTGGFEEQIPTVKSLGEIKFPVNFVPTEGTHSYSSGLIKDWNNKTRRHWQMVFPDSTVWPFTAYVVEIDIKAEVKNKLSADITLGITGSATLA